MEGSLPLRAVQLTKTFSTASDCVTVLQGINYSFSRQKTYAITGASGSGKSTLIHLLAGLESPTSGTVMIGDVDLASLSLQERAFKIGLVFQYPYLIKEISVLENVVIAGLIAGASMSDTQSKALKLLERVGLSSMGSWEVGRLSGGQKQRVALARALITEPDFLLADELTGSLDHETGLEVMQLVLSCVKEWQMGLIISTHNPEVAAMMQLVFSLKDGILISTEQ